MEKASEEILVEKLLNKNMTVTSAESCSGGLISGKIVNVAGVSAAFPGGFVTYANEAKVKLLHVNEETLNKYGAVSSFVAHEMAVGAKTVMGTDCAIAVTGIAGPDGGTKEKPVGLVYIATLCGEKELITENHFSGSRMEIRNQVAEKAIKQLTGMLG